MVGITDSAGVQSSFDIEWTITDSRGNLVATIDGNSSGLSATFVLDEFGNVPSGTAGSRGFTWMLDEQRPSDTSTGFVLMGVRVYNPITGRFFSVDPILGGNANSYVYPLDPISVKDPSGKAGVFVIPAVGVVAAEQFRPQLWLPF